MYSGEWILDNMCTYYVWKPYTNLICDIVLSSKWKVSSGKKFDYYMDFVKKVANATYENIDSMAPYVNNTELINIDIIDLVLKVF